jgi:hypothetical protein
VEFFADAEKALVVAEVVPEVRFRVALGGDDLFSSR